MDFRDPYWPLQKHLLAQIVATFMVNHHGQPMAPHSIVVDEHVTIYPPAKTTFRSPPCGHFTRASGKTVVADV